MLTKIKIKNLIFISIFISLFFYIFFSEKNIILLFKNKKIIQENKIILTQKKEIKGDLEKKINNYTNSEISKELILKDKLFLKNRGDKIILYELDKWVAQYNHFFDCSRNNLIPS